MQGLPCFCLHSQRRKSVNSIRSTTQISPHLSFRRKRSGAVKSHSPIVQRALAAGNLSAPRFMSTPGPDRPYRRIPPLEMTIAPGSIHPFQKGTNDKNVSPHPSFGRKRSGAVKSRSPIAQRALAAGNLSTQRFMSTPGPDRPYRRIPPLEMTIAPGSIHPFQKGTNDKNVSPHLSFRRKGSGEISLCNGAESLGGRRSLDSELHGCPKP